MTPVYLPSGSNNNQTSRLSIKKTKLQPTSNPSLVVSKRDTFKNRLKV